MAATSCDVDSMILAGQGFIDPPFALGDECVAKVVETGDAVTTVTPGDLVVVPWSINCGTCDHCRAGLTAHGTAVPHMAMYGAPVGGSWSSLFSDLVRVPWADAMLVPLPAGLDPVGVNAPCVVYCVGRKLRGLLPGACTRQQSVGARVPPRVRCQRWAARFISTTSSCVGLSPRAAKRSSMLSRTRMCLSRSAAASAGPISSSVSSVQ